MAQTVLSIRIVLSLVHPTRSPNGTHARDDGLDAGRFVLLLRWVLIIATSYLVIFSRPLGHETAGAWLFVAAYFASNILLGMFLPHFHSARAWGLTVVALDSSMVTIGMASTGAASSQFYVMYFLVLFVSALTERLGLVVMAAALISVAYLYTESSVVGVGELLRPAYALRPPFLFVVAMFFGQLVKDTRERQRAAEENGLRQRRMELLSGVSHDLRNPLGVLQMLATLLLDAHTGQLNEQQADLVRRIHASTRQLITMTLNLIDAARIDAGQLSLQRSLVNAGDLVERVVSMAENAATLKGVTLECRAQPRLPVAEMDPIQMERVVSNLVGNALKFTPQGGTVHVYVAHMGGDIILTVSDTGCGIPKEERASAFELYRRGLASGNTEGSGLGLFIVKAIVEAHGGAVALNSTVGEGTRIEVRIPLTQQPQPEPSAACALPTTPFCSVQSA